MKQFKVRCTDSNTAHTRFYVFDPSGANCGEITLRTQDVVAFVTRTWRGDVEWAHRVDDVATNVAQAKREAIDADQK